MINMQECGHIKINKDSAYHGTSSLAGSGSRELSILERGAGVVSSLQDLHAKLSNFRDKIEGVGEIKAGASSVAPYGLTPQITESESILRACHSLLDDIAGKF